MSDRRPVVPEDAAARHPTVGVGVVVGRVALAAAAAFLGVFGLGLAGLAGCCGSDPDGWPLFLTAVGVSWGIALWSIAIVPRTRWLPVFVAAGVGLATLVLFRA